MKIQKEKIKKILIISLQGIGDLLLFTPCLPLLKRNFSNAKISILVLHHVKEIIEDNPYISEVMTYHYHPTRTNYLEILNLLIYLRKEKFDLAICAFPGGVRSALMAYLAGINIRVGHKYNFVKKFPFLLNIKVSVPEIKHVLDIDLDLMLALGIDIIEADKKMFFPILKQDKIFIQNFLQKNNIFAQDLLIGVNPGVDILKKDKCWPNDKFIPLIEKLIKELNVKIVLIGGPSGKSFSAEIVNVFKANAIDATGIMSLKQSVALIERCSLFVGNDSGLIHLSVAMNTPTVAIFGPTDPRLYAPYGFEHAVIRRQLDCSPCAYGICGNLELIKRNVGFVKGTFRCEKGNFECIKSIEVDEVFNVIKNKILNLRKNIENSNSGV